MNTTTRNVTTKGAKETTLVVLVDGKEIGMLVQWKGKGNPWKAYRGVGAAATFVASYYPDNGGKPAALAAVVGS